MLKNRLFCYFVELATFSLSFWNFLRLENSVSILDFRSDFSIIPDSTSPCSTLLKVVHCWTLELEMISLLNGLRRLYRNPPIIAYLTNATADGVEQTVGIQVLLPKQAKLK